MNEWKSKMETTIEGLGNGFTWELIIGAYTAADVSHSLALNPEPLATSKLRFKPLECFSCADFAEGGCTSGTLAMYRDENGCKDYAGDPLKNSHIPIGGGMRKFPIMGFLCLRTYHCIWNPYCLTCCRVDLSKCSPRVEALG